MFLGGVINNAAIATIKTFALLKYVPMLGNLARNGRTNVYTIRYCPQLLNYLASGCRKPGKIYSFYFHVSVRAERLSIWTAVIAQRICCYISSIIRRGIINFCAVRFCGRFWQGYVLLDFYRNVLAIFYCLNMKWILNFALNYK